jgi:hypothetical protein
VHPLQKSRLKPAPAIVLPRSPAFLRQLNRDIRAGIGPSGVAIRCVAAWRRAAAEPIERDRFRAGEHFNGWPGWARQRRMKTAFDGRRSGAAMEQDARDTALGPIYVRLEGPAAAAPAHAVDLFRAGRVEAAAELIAGLDRDALDAAGRDTVDTLYLATRALGLGDTAGLLARLPGIPDDTRPDLRYRALLNHDRTAAAAAFRHRVGPQAADSLRADFAWSLALRALHRGHWRAGFSLYRHRFHAINKVHGAPTQALTHVPATDRPCDTMFLEQGLGDSIYHLALIKGLRGDAPLRVLATARWLPLIRRLFPDWSAVDENAIGRLGIAEANASGDYMGIAWAQAGHRRPTARLMAPLRAMPRRFGILWRGGSHQNRVEERQVPLADLLALLPQDQRYLVLQHDMTDDERRLIARDRRVDLPAFDLRADLESLVEAVSGLAGVIGVDGSAIHIAGCCGVPAWVLMNARPHWYWGPDGTVATLYDDAVTVPLGAPDPDGLAGWCQARSEDHARRARPRRALRGPASKRPVLVTGVPRSGTSLTMGLLAQAGLWTGTTVPGGPPNPKGFFENARVREGLTKPVLQRLMAADPLGVQALPDPDLRFAGPHWARLVSQILADDGHDGRAAWGVKDAKLTLLWPLWAEAFPDAHWVIVIREREAVVRSCLRTPFMRRHSGDPAFWRLFHDAYRGRQAALAARVRGPVHHVHFEDMLAGRFDAVAAIAQAQGLTWSEEAARDFLL